MNPVLIRVFHLYQRVMWYVGVFGSELGKPTRFMTELGILLLLLSDSGIGTSLGVKIGSYVLLLILAIFCGKILVRLGVLSYNNRLNNAENDMLKDILEKVNKIEDRMAKKGNLR